MSVGGPLLWNPPPVHPGFTYFEAALAAALSALEMPVAPEAIDAPDPAGPFVLSSFLGGGK